MSQEDKWRKQIDSDDKTLRRSDVSPAKRRRVEIHRNRIREKLAELLNKRNAEGMAATAKRPQQIREEKAKKDVQANVTTAAAQKRRAWWDWRMKIAVTIAAIVAVIVAIIGLFL